MVPFETLSRCPEMDGSHFFSEHVQWIIDIIFREKNYGLSGFNNFFRTFLLYFLHSHKTYCDVLMITYTWQTSLSTHNDLIGFIYWFSLEGIEFKGC